MKHNKCFTLTIEDKLKTLIVNKRCSVLDLAIYIEKYQGKRRIMEIQIFHHAKI